jgi:hypothetical protein
MTHSYQIEVTDTFAGEANYSWVKRETLCVPELTHFGYDGATNYSAANKKYQRHLIRAAKKLIGWNGVKCAIESWGDTIAIRPRGAALVAFVTFQD